MEENSKEIVNVFVLSKDGTYLENELIEILLSVIEEKFEIANNPAMNHVMMKYGHLNNKPIANAHNMANYLLGEIANPEYRPIVIAWDENSEGMPAPKYMVDEFEINALIEGLENNPDVDAWETIIKVNKEIRE